MEKYVYLNPVIGNTYPQEKLERIFMGRGFTIVYCRENWPQIVKEKYRKAAEQAESPIVDQRCPMFAEKIALKDPKQQFTYPEIEPIFLHAAREIAGRPDLKGGLKWIVAPCTPLVLMGQHLELPDTTFITWKDFLAELGIEQYFTEKAETPIPLGFFDDLGLTVKGLTGAEAVAAFDPADYQDVSIIEGLYCKGGCHSGDGMV